VLAISLADVRSLITRFEPANERRGISMKRPIHAALSMPVLALAACSAPSGAHRHTGSDAALGAAPLAGGRPAEAEAVYRDDLKRNPENGWSLFGLARSLEAQGKAADAATAEARFRKAWARADVTLSASRF
jgi:hypothetical protein